MYKDTGFGYTIAGESFRPAVEPLPKSVPVLVLPDDELEAATFEAVSFAPHMHDCIVVHTPSNDYWIGRLNSINSPPLVFLGAEPPYRPIDLEFLGKRIAGWIGALGARSIPEDVSVHAQRTIKLIWEVGLLRAHFGTWEMYENKYIRFQPRRPCSIPTLDPRTWYELVEFKHSPLVGCALHFLDII
jgi:hypothetical protein